MTERPKSARSRAHTRRCQARQTRLPPNCYALAARRRQQQQQQPKRNSKKNKPRPRAPLLLLLLLLSLHAHTTICLAVIIAPRCVNSGRGKIVTQVVRSSSSSKRAPRTHTHRGSPPPRTHARTRAVDLDPLPPPSRE